MNTRKIIQVLMGDEDRTEERSLYALCDDGTLWFYFKPHDLPWAWVRKDFPPIPQDDSRPPGESI